MHGSRLDDSRKPGSGATKPEATNVEDGTVEHLRIILPPASATAKFSCTANEPQLSDIVYTFAHWAVALITNGHGTIEHAGRSYTIVPGTLICSPPGRVHIDLSRDAEVLVISLEERAAARDEMWRAFSVPLVRQLQSTDVTEWAERLSIAERKIAAGAFGDNDVRALKSSLLRSFWLSGRPAGRHIVLAAFGTMERQLERITNLDDLASDLGYTRNHLSDLMHDLTGSSLGAWLTGKRMERARDALSASDLPIALVGTAIGYGDAAYFSRAFRRYHGVPPQLWRLAHRPEDERRAAIVADFDDLVGDVA